MNIAGMQRLMTSSVNYGTVGDRPRFTQRQCTHRQWGIGCSVERRGIVDGCFVEIGTVCEVLVDCLIVSSGEPLF